MIASTSRESSTRDCVYLCGSETDEVTTARSNFSPTLSALPSELPQRPYVPLHPYIPYHSLLVI
jgi:hypothetical protein